MRQAQPILFFDGDCTMCNYWVDFVIQHETSPEIQFSSLQSEHCLHFFEKNGFYYNVDSIVFWDGNQFWVKSDAIINLSTRLKRPHAYLKYLKFIPCFVRDLFYDLVARNRHKWFGTKSFCRIPTAEEQVRFLSN
jgi:predicted DCC family thiol-disulfide oxidoreductase YuxK